jgi:hypothetical protein
MFETDPVVVEHATPAAGHDDLRSTPTMTTTTLTHNASLIAMPNMIELKLADRCDKCGAQAFVAVNFLDESGSVTDSQLLFCGHHYSAFEPRLATLKVSVTDHRGRINAEPSISANAI